MTHEASRTGDGGRPVARARLRNTGGNHVIRVEEPGDQRSARPDERCACSEDPAERPRRPTALRRSGTIDRRTTARGKLCAEGVAAATEDQFYRVLQHVPPKR